jgi:hypothetical protein
MFNPISPPAYAPPYHGRVVSCATESSYHDENLTSMHIPHPTFNPVSPMPSAVPQFFGQVRQVMTGGTVNTMNVGDSNPVHHHYPSEVNLGYLVESFGAPQAH